MNTVMLNFELMHVTNTFQHYFNTVVQDSIYRIYLPNEPTHIINPHTILVLEKKMLMYLLILFWCDSQCR